MPVTNGSVTLADSAATATTSAVTCRVTNRLATGSLQINKVVDAPPGAYTGGTTKTFSGSYNCGTGFTGHVQHVDHGVAGGDRQHPRESHVHRHRERRRPAGSLNASYAWGTPTYSTQPVTIADQATAAGHHHQPGRAAVRHVLAHQGGRRAGRLHGRHRPGVPGQLHVHARNGPTTSGTLNVTLAQAVSPATPIPAGSVCSFTETLTDNAGDFSDPSYVWTGFTVSPTTVTIGDGTTATVTLTNTYVREFGSLAIAKVVSGDGYLGGTGAELHGPVRLRLRRSPAP